MLELPAELRTIIWSLAFTHNDLPINLVTAFGPSSALLCTCRQIYNEAIQIYKQAYAEYWPTGRFEISYDVTNEGLRCIGDSKLQQLNYLKIHGGRVSYIFVSGVWNCTKLCKSEITEDISISMGRCPKNAVQESNFDPRTATAQPQRKVIHWAYWSTDDDDDDGDYDNHQAFWNGGAGAGIEKLQKACGWIGLRKSELKAMLAWFKMAVKEMPGVGATPPMLFI